MLHFFFNTFHKMHPVPLQDAMPGTSPNGDCFVLHKSHSFPHPPSFLSSLHQPIASITQSHCTFRGRNTLLGSGFVQRLAHRAPRPQTEATGALGREHIDQVAASGQAASFPCLLPGLFLSLCITDSVMTALLSSGGNRTAGRS